jgi:hypothetical protein
MTTVKRKQSPVKSRTSFVREGSHQDWTNTFSRSTVHWDKSKEILD